jgi:hypothetical protein
LMLTATVHAPGVRYRLLPHRLFCSGGGVSGDGNPVCSTAKCAAINRKSANEQNQVGPVPPTTDVRTHLWMTLICYAIVLPDCSH